VRRSFKPRSGFLKHAGLLFGVMALVAGVGVLVWQLVWLRALAAADQTASVAATTLAIVVTGLALVKWWRAPSVEPRSAIAPALESRSAIAPVVPPVPAEEPSPSGGELGTDKGTGAIALGVHPAIPLVRGIPEDLDATLPTFVPRDRGGEVAAWMRSVASVGGVLVVVGP
jgi:hypothetical protein